MRLLIAGLTLVVLAVTTAAQQTDDWPTVTREMKPWTRWWWHGSAVEADGLTTQLQQLHEVGIGGVEITPIYGVRGTETRFLRYLSPEWMTMLDHALATAQRLGLGVDMATGTGWPFGGPWVDERTAPRTIVHRSWNLDGGQRLNDPIRARQTPLVRAVGAQIHVVNEGAPGDPPRGATLTQPIANPAARPIQIGDLVEPVEANRNLQALALEQVKYARDLPLAVLVASGPNGASIDLTSRVDAAGMLDWTAPDGRWTLDAIFAGWHGKLVERAAPGGEGNVIDHFSRDAIRRYVLPFDRAFASRRLDGLRGFFNDSYEVDDASGQADWTGGLFEEFRKRRGYDLRQQLPALFGRDAADRNALVIADYRETIADLLLETFTAEWAQWAKRRNKVVRNQAHGSPASILDLYAASGIPETEGYEIQRFKWATSAAHVAGKPLVSAEAATWLGEHFRSTLADVRAALDRFFVAGVNHIVYHGTAYSPPSEPWPGWLFYAAVAFSPQNTWWDDFAALNAYVTRTQSFLQTSRADHDVLLYYPLYDALSVRGNAMLTHFGGASPRAQGTAFEQAAESMQHRGYTYDFISDRQLRATRTVGRELRTAGGARYRVLILPASRFIPLETLESIIGLATAGATVISLEDWPSGVSGLADQERRRRRLTLLLDSVRFGSADAGGILEARVGRGRVLRGAVLDALLERAGVHRERLVDTGLAFSRRIDANDRRIYFLSNPTDRAVDGWLPLTETRSSITIFDPMSGALGRARTRAAAATGIEVFARIPAGGSVILTTSMSPATASFAYYDAAGPATPIAGPWRVDFVKGGPERPASRTIEKLTSWTTIGGDEMQRFSGSADYTVRFSRPGTPTADAWEVNLGTVRDSARVTLNGREQATLIGPTYRLTVPASALAETNTLTIRVTNLAANRVADLDRRGVPWKKFYNVNFPARLPDNRGADGLFSAAKWTPLDSGLIGPVTIRPMQRVRE
jgi:hypothetical protein